MMADCDKNGLFFWNCQQLRISVAFLCFVISGVLLYLCV